MPTILIDQITVDRSARQRKELKNIPELAASIGTIGLINPIVVTEAHELMAGERRLEAVRSLGWDSIPVTIFADLSPAQQQLLELEENVKREDLPWRDHCAATAAYHRLRVSEDPSWTQTGSAGALGISRQHILNLITVQEAIEEGNELVQGAEKFSTARGIIERQRQRQGAAREQTTDTIVDGLISAPTTLGQGGEAEPESQSSNAGTLAAALGFTLKHTSFLDWLEATPERDYNFIHCDFPYGISAGKHNMGAGKSFGAYDDSPDVYWLLLEGLAQAVRRGIVAKSAHLMFWFSMDYYTETKAILEAQGWTVNPFPLYWHRSDNSGIMPDPKRGPRRVVETAFVATLGDRFVAQPISNFFAHPNEKRIHMSEKPQAMLAHFLRMFVDGSTKMLDPTMGSANAVRVAIEMGAASATGLEQNEEFFLAACEAHDDLLGEG